jgi:hypothetical protein
MYSLDTAGLIIVSTAGYSTDTQLATFESKDYNFLLC